MTPEQRNTIDDATHDEWVAASRNMKMEISKEWAEKSAKIEGDAAVGAGLPSALGLPKLAAPSGALALATGSAFRRIGWPEAERLLGGRVDRRKAFYFCDDPQMMEFLCGGPVFEYGEWTTSCSGCFETEDGHPVGKYQWDAKHRCHIGGGCSECGYTGKRRDGWHSPAQLLPNIRSLP